MGKSGSFFFFSHDNQFLIKTMTLGDFKAFKKLSKAYFEHVNRYPKSILARIYGVYSVQMDEQDPVYLILMGNSKKCEDEYVKKIFDLKGSMVKREVRMEEGKPFKNTAVLKDKNFLQLKKDEKTLLFQEQDIKSLITQIGLDISLLNHFNLMDYSLLFVIEYNPKYVKLFPNEFEHDKDGNLVLPIKPTKEQQQTITAHNVKFNTKKLKKDISDKFLSEMAVQTDTMLEENLNNLRAYQPNFGTTRPTIGQPSTFFTVKKSSLKDLEPELYAQLIEGRQSRHSCMSEDGKYIYHLGIIDYLQDFNMEKKGENWFKSLISDGTMISAVPPKHYKERYFNFMQNQVVINQEAVDVTRKEINLKACTKEFKKGSFKY